MRTQLLLRYKPVRASVLPPLVQQIYTGPLTAVQSLLNGFAYRSFDNQNWNNDLGALQAVGISTESTSVDLYEDIQIPLNYTILDIREPEKRKTNFSKTIRLPGTKKNNKLFNHIYEISGSSKFNPNLRTEVVILQDGVQVIRGNMQLVNMTRFNDNEVEYEVLISGDFTSLFSDIGVSKLRDLDFSEYNHIWNRETIQSSWSNLVNKTGGNLTVNGLPATSTVTTGTQKNFTSILRQASTGRVQINTTTSHGLNVNDFVRVFPDDTDTLRAPLIRGDFAVSEILSTTSFTINYPFPDGLYGNTLSGYVQKWNPTGKGYVYPMISWGDDSLINGVLRFPTQAFNMSFYVKEIWDKIFEKTNSRYESKFLDSNLFKRLVLTQKKTNYEIPLNELNSRQFKVANDVPYNIQISGFGSQDSGFVQAIRGNPKSYPNFTSPTLLPYSFTSSVANSDGFLYNGNIGEEPFKQDISKWVVTDNGKYSLNFAITFDVKMDISDWRRPANSNTWSSVAPTQSTNIIYYWGGWPTAQFNEAVEVIVKIKLKSDGITTTLNESMHSFKYDSNNVIIKDTFKNWRFEARSIGVGFEDRYLRKDDELWIEVAFINDFNNTINGLFTEIEQVGPPPLNFYARRGQFYLRTLGIQVLQNKAGNTITEGDEIFPEQFLPKDLTCRDFLLAIIRMFNLHIESDKEIEKYYYIEPRDDYYKDGSGGASDFVDWTDKVDLESIDITPMGELTAKYYSFEYKTENDYWNKKYFDDTGQVYGNYTKEVQNDFLTNTQKISLPFGSTVMINNPENTAIVIPQVVQRDNNNQNKVTNTSSKLLFWGGLRPTSRGTSIYSWNFIESFQSSIGATQTAVTSYTGYPYAGTCDSPLDPELDLNWFYTDYVYWNRARWSNDNLYNKYWRRFIEEITDQDSKVVRCKVKLLAKDIYNLDFKKIYVINNHWLRLQKIIDYNANGEGLTQCEFLKLKSPSKFKRQSILVSQEFLSTIDNSRPIGIIIDEKPPRDFTVRNPLSNFTAGELSGQNTVVFNGENNLVSARSNNISISGNENFVGSNSNNISISGDGVFVSGGLQNVNVIGTNKVVVDESDVTYINGIRYKNGVAISRANVIDGGLNKVLDKSAPNTVQNIIDAGEDVVINYGSQTYENIINAGSDRILPDIPNYGVSTLTSPNPTTNLTGGVWKSPSLTQNTVDEIISRVNPVPYINL